MKSGFVINKTLKMITKNSDSIKEFDIESKDEVLDRKKASKETGFSYHAVTRAMNLGELQYKILAGRMYTTWEWLSKWRNTK